MVLSAEQRRSNIDIAAPGDDKNVWVRWCELGVVYFTIRHLVVKRVVLPRMQYNAFGVCFSSFFSSLFHVDVVWRDQKKKKKLYVNNIVFPPLAPLTPAG